MIETVNQLQSASSSPLTVYVQNVVGCLFILSSSCADKLLSVSGPPLYMKVLYVLCVSGPPLYTFVSLESSRRLHVFTKSALQHCLCSSRRLPAMALPHAAARGEKVATSARRSIAIRSPAPRDSQYRTVDPLPYEPQLEITKKRKLALEEDDTLVIECDPVKLAMWRRRHGREYRHACRCGESWEDKYAISPCPKCYRPLRDWREPVF